MSVGAATLTAFSTADPPAAWVNPFDPPSVSTQAGGAESTAARRRVAGVGAP